MGCKHRRCRGTAALKMLGLGVAIVVLLVSAQPAAAQDCNSFAPVQATPPGSNTNRIVGESVSGPGPN